jgi:oxygen-independent coproporphyrinogen-3 oxidase|tara:strand:+ start:4955 stop:6139 length:1185 start_codon:yes stop_codon:yes gene_type:complete
VTAPAPAEAAPSAGTRAVDESIGLGLYVHVPFCDAICTYCNFTRGLFDAALVRRYVEVVIKEIATAPTARAADTIYFGGGTPSVLEPEDVKRILVACRSSRAVGADAEITMEANPESATAARLNGYRDAGVTRLSLGVQSFRDAELATLGRLHTSRGARDAVDRARQAGFDDLSLDLMMWLPGQTIDAWLESVDALIAMEPDHASIYLLDVYPNAPLRDEMARVGSTQAPDDVAAEMYLAALDRLDEAGFQQYEISNVARPNHRSRHNMKYWTDGSWVGFGPGAHSTLRADRWSNIPDTAAYVARLEAGQDPTQARQRRSAADQASEAMFMGLRLAGGVEVAGVEKRHAIDVRARFGAALRPFIDGGQLVDDGNRLRLTRAGMLLANEVMAVFV